MITVFVPRRRQSLSPAGPMAAPSSGTCPIPASLSVSSFPEPVKVGTQEESSELASAPWLLSPDETTVVLDGAWWLGTEEVAAFPEEVIRHLREHPRRPITRAAWLAPQAAEAWRTVPVTIIIGRSDSLIPAEQKEWVRTHFDDARIVEGDHFLPLLQPDLVAEVICETFVTANWRHRS